MKNKYKQLEKLYKNNLRCADYFWMDYCESVEWWIQRTWKPWSFTYLDAQWNKINNKKILQYIKDLVIPPAWKNTYVSLNKKSHILAQWEDAKMRKQYIYNDSWIQARRLLNSYTLILFWEVLWDIRSWYKKLLKSDKNSKDFALWVALMLIDKTVIRVGNKDYFDENGTVWVSTLRCENLKIKWGRLYLNFSWKSWKEHKIHITHRKLKKCLQELCSWWEEFIFSYKQNNVVREIIPSDINKYMRELGCEVITAKDFRSWHASMIVFNSFVEEISWDTSEKQRKKIILESFDSAAEKLGNTRSMIKESYAHSDTVETVKQATFRKYYNATKSTKKIRNLSHRESEFLEFLKRLYDENISFE